MAGGARDDVRYTAFLSYSHQDAAAAGRLHRRLEFYRIPRRLVGKETPRGPVPARLWPIFRDRDELPAASDLSETVRTALAQSGALIILCSPASAGSLWVAEEIKVFRELHPGRPILAAILDGSPPDCFPAALRAFGRDGTWHEPLATDLRPGKDGARLGLLKLVAGITGVALDELVQRDAARRIRRVMAVTGVAVAAMLIMAALAVVALRARAEAERQRAEAEGLIEFMLTDLRERLRSVRRLDIMTAVNRKALDFYGGQRELRNLSPESLDRRARVLLAIGEDDLERRSYPAALVAFNEAHRTTAEQLSRSPNDPARIFTQSQSEYWVGYVGYLQRDFVAARAAWQNYKRLTELLLTIDANNASWVREASYADGNLCTLAMEAPEAAREALQICSSSLQRMEQAARLEAPDSSMLVALANRQGWMVDVWAANGRWDRALLHRARHEQIVQSLMRSEPQNFDYRDIWMKSQFGFGRLLARRGQTEEAHRRFADAAATAAILLARDPENASWRMWQQRIAQAMR